jgi:hypothetical protein
MTHVEFLSQHTGSALQDLDISMVHKQLPVASASETPVHLIRSSVLVP